MMFPRNMLKPALVILSLVLFTACRKDFPPNNIPFAEDELLLSRISGTFQDDYLSGLNTFLYKDGNFLQTFSYENIPGRIKPILQIGGINGGTWDFTYNGFFPDKTLDNSRPGIDQGYWQYFFSSRRLIEKTGLAFKTTEAPRQFEFYTYDAEGRMKTLVYGQAPDTPIFKLTYTYDHAGNLDSFYYYLPVGYTDAAASAALLNPPKTELMLKNPGAATQRKAIFPSLALRNRNTTVTNSSGHRQPADSNVIYQIGITAKIICDNGKNPFAQQGRILFYQTNRLYVFNLLDFFLPLMKHNPTHVVYMVDPAFGGMVAGDDFTYTYNRHGYPESIHQVRTDPDFLDSYNYTQDRVIEYIDPD